MSTNNLTADGNLMELLLDHIQHTQYDDLPDSTIAAVKTFVWDSIGVGISGSRVPLTAALINTVEGWGQRNSSAYATIWLTGQQVPVGSAAYINGFQMHNQEWDCVHEGAVVHPMATILAALLAYAEYQQSTPQQLILGIALAVDVATLLGQSVTSPLKFFRPATCGALGATAGICAMLGLNRTITANAMGIVYSQISGTMQAHTEGSIMLPVQIGINARAATQAVDLALAGVCGPKDILLGPFGFLHLFEDAYDLSRSFPKLGKEFQIERVSHKPFPTGRACHGTVDALQTLQQQHGFSWQEIERIEVEATPLIMRLVGREVKDDMDSAWAKLCNGYVAATALLTGSVGVADFDAKWLRDPQRLALAAKVHTRISDTYLNSKDKNAGVNDLAPLTVMVILTSGKHYSMTLPAVLGHPERPLPLAQQQQKFELACASALRPLPAAQIEQLQHQLQHLEQVNSVRELVQLTVHPDFIQSQGNTPVSASAYEGSTL